MPGGLTTRDHATASCALAFAHPERLGILHELRAGELVSGSLYADRHPGSARPNRAAYHLRILAEKAGAAVLREPPRDHPARRGRQHKVYALGGRNADRLRDVIDLFAGAVAVLPDGGGPAAPVAGTDSDLLSIGKAMKEPLRLQLVRDMRRVGESSPKRSAEALGVTLAVADHHLKVLASLRAADIIRTEKRRGADEHLYTLSAARSRALLVVLDVLEDRAALVTTSAAGVLPV